MKLLVHPGFAKCASTTVQRFLFDAHPTINNVGKPYGNRPAVHAFMKRLYLAPVTQYDSQEMLRQYQSAVKPLLSDDVPNVLSDERLTNADGIDPGIIASRLHEVFPYATVLFVIRKPADFLESLYSHRFSKRQVTTSFDQWFETYAANPTNGPVERANFFATIGAFSREFGQEAVHVVAFEEMIADPACFVEKICRVAGVPVEPTIPMLKGERDTSTVRISALQRMKLSSQLIRRGEAVARRVLPSTAISTAKAIVGSGPRARPRLSEKWHQHLDETCRAGNRSIANEFGIDLERLGYPC